jgi:type IV secretion system protein VirD4
MYQKQNNIFSTFIDWLKGEDPKSGLHGSARFCTFKEVQSLGLCNNPGVYIGGFESFGVNHYLRHNGPEHILAIAPTRSGKGVGLVLPTLLSWKESALVLDIKGENWALTAGWRSQYANNTCFRFDVKDPDSAKYNPLEEVRVETDFEISDAQNIAAMIVDPDGSGMDDHWTSTAFSLLAGAILHVCYTERDLNRKPTISSVLKLLTNPEKTIQVVLEEIMKTCHCNRAPHPFIASVARDILNKSENERSGVVSTATTKLSLYHDPIVAKITSKSDFKIRDLMNLEKPVSLYLVVPPSDSARVMPLLRLIINQIMRTLTEKMEFQNGSSVKHYNHRLLLMIDEFPSLGKLEIFEKSLAFIAGYGLKAYLIIQDLSQLYKAYGKDESITSNCHVQVVYAPNKMETADYVSRMLGQTTVAHKVVNISHGRGLFATTQKSESYQHTQRPLMTADEVRTLPGPQKNADGKIIKAGDMLIFISGQSTIYGKQILYFNDPYFMNAASVAPPKEILKINTEDNTITTEQIESLMNEEHITPRSKDYFYDNKKNSTHQLQKSSDDNINHSSAPAPIDSTCEEEPPDLQQYSVGPSRNLEA